MSFEPVVVKARRIFSTLLEKDKMDLNRLLVVIWTLRALPRGSRRRETHVTEN